MSAAPDTFSDQINAVASAQAQEQAKVEAEKARQARIQAHKRLRQEKIAAQKRAEYKREVSAALNARKRQQVEHEREVSAALNARKRQQVEHEREFNAALNARKRQQAYQEKLNSLNVEARELKLQSMKVRVSRENDYVDQQLKMDQAKTNVVQSHADASRSLSTGTEDYMKERGKADMLSACHSIFGCKK